MAYNDAWLPNTLAYLGVRSIESLLHLYDVDRCLAVVGELGEKWFRYDSRRRARSYENVRRSFPELGEAEALDLVRRSMRHLMQLFVVEVAYSPRLITPATWMNYVSLRGIGGALRVLTDRQPAIFISGHCGNFELLGFTLAVVGFRLNAIARPLDLPRINEWLVDIREKRGMKIVTKFGVMNRLPEFIEAGKSVSFVGDQNAGDKGMFVPFFGRLASAYKSIGLLAMRYRLPIVCGHSVRVRPDHFQYEIRANDIIYPDEWITQPDPLYYITARYSRAIEMMVRAAPEQYFWLHRRWKSRPRHERMGKPVPAWLQEKIAQLPWMDDAMLARIIETSNREAMEHAAAAARTDNSASAVCAAGPVCASADEASD